MVSIVRITFESKMMKLGIIESTKIAILKLITMVIVNLKMMKILLLLGTFSNDNEYVSSKREGLSRVEVEVDIDNRCLFW